MQNFYSSTLNSQPGRGGGRVASAEYRQSLEVCGDFAGLEENTNRYDLLLLVKRVGKASRFSPRMIQLLDYYMAFTRDVDWEEGSRPIVYQSLSRTAFDLGVSERQVQKLEKQLFTVGVITWNDSGNHKRYGQRDASTGKILYAYGVDLTPLAYMKAELEDKLHEKQLYVRAWMETKRQISWYRRQIRSMLLECEREEGALMADLRSFERAYDEIAIEIRNHMPLEKVRALLERHKHLHSDLIAHVEAEEDRNSHPTQQASMDEETTQQSSCTHERKFTHYKYTTHESFDKSNTSSQTGNGFQKSVAKSSERQTDFQGNEKIRKHKKSETTKENLLLATGLQHITLNHVLQSGSDRFREFLPLEPRPMNWADVTDAAYRLRPQLHISQQSWGQACELLGRTGASICILLTDQAMQRPDNSVTKPAAYFYGMINKARVGELRLHSSIFGLIDHATERENY